MTFLRWVWWLFERLLTRTRVSGLENIPLNSDTPLIFASNHASTYDPLLLAMHIPLRVRPVGPGDFKLLFPGNVLIKYAGVIRIQRGSADRDSLKQMTDVLKNGENLILFPDGGTWEKRLEEVKPGVAYLSHTTGARIVPAAISGTYQVWHKIFRLQRPSIRLHFLPPLPPVAISDRKKRAEELQGASVGLMHAIYPHLSPAEQARFDLHARQKFGGALLTESADLTVDHDFSVMAELVSKPNLFSPLYRNLKLPLQPFIQTGVFHDAEAFRVAVQALQTALNGAQKEYLSYRLGEDKAHKALAELDELLTVSGRAEVLGIRLCFVPTVQVMNASGRG